jgi:hypothetical protein
MTTDQLNYLLSKCYEQAVVKNGDVSPQIGDLKKRLAANQNLMAEAKALLASLTDQITQRCFVSKKKKEFLTKALEV